MQLRATIGGRNGGDFTRTVDINSQKDFSKVERAAAAWARQELRAMPTFGSPRRTACLLLIEWVEPPSPKATAPLVRHSAKRDGGRRKK